MSLKQLRGTLEVCAKLHEFSVPPEVPWETAKVEISSMTTQLGQLDAEILKLRKEESGLKEVRRCHLPRSAGFHFFYLQKSDRLELIIPLLTKKDSNLRDEIHVAMRDINAELDRVRSQVDGITLAVVIGWSDGRAE